MYDLTTGRARLTLDTKRETPAAIAPSPDGKTIADIRDTSVYLHNAATGEGIGQIGCPRSRPQFGMSLGFAPDGKRIVVTEGNSVHLIDVAKREIVRTLAHGDVVFAAAFAPDGKHLVTGGAESDNGDHFARLWDTETGKELFRLPFGNADIRCAAYAPDGKTVAASGDKGKELLVKLFDPATGKERLAIPFPDANSVHSVAFSPDSKVIASSGGSVTRLFDAATGKELVKIDRKAIGLRFLPDGETLVGAVANTIYRWDAKTGKSLTAESAESPVSQIIIPPDGKRVITRGVSGDTHVWDPKTGKWLQRLAVVARRGFVLSPDGRLLVWPENEGKTQPQDPVPPKMPRSDTRLRAFDLADGKPVERFEAFAGEAHDLFFTADGKVLVTVDYRTATVRFWDPATGKVDRSLQVGNGARLVVGARTIVAGREGAGGGVPGGGAAGPRPQTLERRNR